MTEIHHIVCDECGKCLVRCESHKEQLMFTLSANYDSDISEAHFCGINCLRKYVKKVKEHYDLPVVYFSEIFRNPPPRGERPKSKRLM